jgi:5-methylcytosine-specific restriction endonuclease McrA
MQDALNEAAEVAEMAATTRRGLSTPVEDIGQPSGSGRAGRIQRGSQSEGGTQKRARQSRQEKTAVEGEDDEALGGEDGGGIDYSRLFTKAVEDAVLDAVCGGSKRPLKPLCGWCGKLIDLELREAECDHAVPYAHGGRTDRSNFLLLHTTCNKEKGRKSLMEGPCFMKLQEEANARME